SDLFRLIDRWMTPGKGVVDAGLGADHGRAHATAIPGTCIVDEVDHDLEGTIGKREDNVGTDVMPLAAGILDRTIEKQPVSAGKGQWTGEDHFEALSEFTGHAVERNDLRDRRPARSEDCELSRRHLVAVDRSEERRVGKG